MTNFDPPIDRTIDPPIDRIVGPRIPVPPFGGPVVVDGQIIGGALDSLIGRGATTPGYQTADAVLRDVLAKPGSDAFKEIKQWHEDGVSLVEMAMKMRNAAGSVWDGLSFEKRVILVRISENKDQADAIRAATLAKIEAIENGNTVAALTVTPDTTNVEHFWLVPVDCRLDEVDKNTRVNVVQARGGTVRIEEAR